MNKAKENIILKILEKIYIAIISRYIFQLISKLLKYLEY